MTTEIANNSKSCSVEKQPFPTEILTLLIENHRNSGALAGGCQECSAICCVYGGFALLENVRLIYQKYLNGLLVRDDYEFRKKLSFKEFVCLYFDVPPFSPVFPLFFHTKLITKDDKLISHSYYDINLYTGSPDGFETENTRSAGCIFLSKKIPVSHADDHDASRHCILHDPESSSHLTAKPIECVFHTCSTPCQIRPPRARLAHQWRNILSKCYPDSHERFNSIMKAERNG